MKKYLGSAFTVFAAVLCPLFVIVPIVFSIIALTSELSAATVFFDNYVCSRLPGLC